MNKYKSILVTGGTGTFGQNFIKSLLKDKKFQRIIIFSRDELKQSEMKNSKIFSDKKRLRFFLGDIRDKQRLNYAFSDVDVVVHAAALKQVDTAEYNPIEFVKTNVIGAQNIIEAAMESKVKKVIALSTDKAVSPVNLYGATKLCSDKLFIASNNFKGKNEIKFSIVRYGNVDGSRGSIIPLFLNQDKKNEQFTITDENMTRFSISVEKAVEMVSWSITNSLGGDIIIPKIKSYNILDLANSINAKRKKKIIGLRPGEKIFEELISESDSEDCYDIGKYFLLIPKNIAEQKYKKILNKKSKKRFSYNSMRNQLLSKLELKKIVQSVDLKLSN